RRFGGALAAGGRSVAVTAAAAPSAAPTPAPFAAGTVVAVGGAGGFAFPARRAILGLVGLRHALGLDDDAAHAGVADAVGFHVRVVLKGHVDDAAFLRVEGLEAHALARLLGALGEALGQVLEAVPP